MTNQQRLNIYKRICTHSAFSFLPDKLQEVLSLKADGYTDAELSKKYNVSHGTPWSYRESAFKKLGFKVWDPWRRGARTRGATRAMTLEEVKIWMQKSGVYL